MLDVSCDLLQETFKNYAEGYESRRISYADDLTISEDPRDAVQNIREFKA